MPTVTQHLEQRVAALQSDLNTKDEQIDALTFSDNDRELSRRSWFDEAKRLEKEVEVLRSDIRHLNSDLRIANDTVALGVKILAERDALLCEVLEFIDDGVGRSDAEWSLIQKVRTALSASAEPAGHVNRLCHIDHTAHPYRCGCLKGNEEAQRIYDDHCKSANPRAPAERDERACCQHPNIVPRSQIADGKFLGYFCKDCDVFLGLDRADLERKPCH